MIQIESTSKNTVMVVRVTGRLDAATSNEFEQVCEGAVAAGAQSLILEVSQLRYVTLRLAGLGGMVREVFEISGFSGLFPQHESVDAAVAETG